MGPKSYKLNEVPRRGYICFSLLLVMSYKFLVHVRSKPTTIE